MIWGAITAQGTCNLWFLPKNTTINGETYLTILKKEVRKLMRLRKSFGVVQLISQNLSELS